MWNQKKTKNTVDHLQFNKSDTHTHTHSRADERTNDCSSAFSGFPIATRRMWRGKSGWLTRPWLHPVTYVCVLIWSWTVATRADYKINQKWHGYLLFYIFYKEQVATKTNDMAAKKETKTKIGLTKNYIQKWREIWRCLVAWRQSPRKETLCHRRFSDLLLLSFLWKRGST